MADSLLVATVSAWASSARLPRQMNRFEWLVRDPVQAPTKDPSGYEGGVPVHNVACGRSVAPTHTHNVPTVSNITGLAHIPRRRWPSDATEIPGDMGNMGKRIYRVLHCRDLEVLMLPFRQMLQCLLDTAHCRPIYTKKAHREIRHIVKRQNWSETSSSISIQFLLMHFYILPRP